MGRIPTDSVLRNWIQSYWHPYGIKVEHVQNLSKGFFLFQFFDPESAKQVLAKGPSYVNSALLLCQPWTQSFNFHDEVSLVVPVWVEFPSLPTALWPFLHGLPGNIGEFLCEKPTRFFATTRVKVDLAKTLKEFITIQVGDSTITQRVVHINLPNTCYRC